MDIKATLSLARERGASDLHIILSCPPLLRIDGNLQPVDETPLTREDIDEVLSQVVTPVQLDKFNKEMELLLPSNMTFLETRLSQIGAQVQIR